MNTNVANQVTVTVPFADMVRNLFKANPGLEPVSRPADYIADTLMHAAIGVAGEASELILAACKHDADNILEELGDARFYLQVFFNTFGWTMESFEGAELQTNLDQWPTDVFTCFSVASGELLDIVKKLWVYNKPLDAVALFDAVNLVVSFYNGVLVKYNLQDQQVQQANQTKLGKRYPQGVYTDAAAQARADKVAA